MADRSQYQVQARIVRHGGRINSYSYRGAAADDWVQGAILSPGEGSYMVSVNSPIDDQVTGPIRAIALSDFDGGAIETVPIQEFDADTVFEAQMQTGTATIADVYKRGTLVQDATTGNYAVSLVSDANASLEVIDVEPVYDPASQYATGTYNKVWFRFLSDVLDATPSLS